MHDITYIWDLKSWVIHSLANQQQQQSWTHKNTQENADHLAWWVGGRDTGNIGPLVQTSSFKMNKFSGFNVQHAD